MLVQCVIEVVQRVMCSTLVATTIHLLYHKTRCLGEDLVSTDPCAKFQSGGMPGLLEFATPNYPEKYPSGVNCIRLIQAPVGYDILLHFSGVFEIETAYGNPSNAPSQTVPPCPNDYLEVRDGRYSFSPLLGRLCGTRAPTHEIRAKSGSLWLNFHTDDLLEHRGFSARYEFIRSVGIRMGRSPPAECHHSFAMPLDGRINTSSLRGFYLKHRGVDNPSLDCVWQIQVPRWLSIAVFVEEFELASPNQCGDNYLEIYGGVTARQPMKRYCGMSATHTYTGQSTVFVRFFALGPAQVHASHVKILFSTYVALRNCSEHGLFACGDDICVPQVLVCNSNANCLFRKDELNCEKERSAVELLIASNYSPIFVVLSLMSLAVIVLCIHYKPFECVGDDELMMGGHLKVMIDGIAKLSLTQVKPLDASGRSKFLDDFESSLHAVVSSPLESSLMTGSTSVDSLEKEVLSMIKLSGRNHLHHYVNCGKGGSGILTTSSRGRRGRREESVDSRKKLSNGSACGVEVKREQPFCDNQQMRADESKSKGKVRIVYISESSLKEIPHSCTCTYVPAPFSPSIIRNSLPLPQIYVEGDPDGTMDKFN